MTVSLSIFTTDPVLPYDVDYLDPAISGEFAGTTLTARASMLERATRVYRTRFRGGETKRASILAFWLARRSIVTLFYFRDRLDYTRTAIVPTGLVNGSNTVYTIPVGDPYGGDYPIEDANAVLKVNGVAVSKTTSTDGRTMTAAVAPAGGTTVTMDYWYYRRVHFVADRFPLSHPIVGTFEMRLDLAEESA